MTHSIFADATAFPVAMTRLLTLAVALSFTACAQRESAELEWARAALQRNPNVEIVATDAQAGVFTVRDKLNGAVTTVSMKDLAAVPASQLAQTPPAAPATATPPTSPTGPRAPEAVAPGKEVAEESAPPTEPPTEPAAPRAAEKNYTIERAGGQLKVSGPGISIVSAGTVGAAGTQGAQAHPSADPIICEGRRMVHFDSRNIFVDGDAIIARGGCELYVTNSRVVASGTGIVVQDAVVHIANSQIEGGIASFNAQSGAKLFVRGSTFQGISRRDENASVQDQGGNQWH